MVEWNWRCERVDLEVKKERKFFLFPTRRRLGLLFFFSFSADLFFPSLSLLPSSVLPFPSSFRQLCPFCPLSSHVVYQLSRRLNDQTRLFRPNMDQEKKKCLILVLMSYRSILLLPLPSSLFLSLFFFVSFFYASSSYYTRVYQQQQQQRTNFSIRCAIFFVFFVTCALPVSPLKRNKVDMIVLLNRCDKFVTQFEASRR